MEFHGGDLHMSETRAVMCVARGIWFYIYSSFSYLYPSQFLWFSSLTLPSFQPPLFYDFLVHVYTKNQLGTPLL